MGENPKEFDALVERYGALMASAIRKVCARRHRALIPDVEQEVRLALWKHLKAGNEIRHPSSYLYKMALTTALNLVRRSGAERETPLDESTPPASPEGRPVADLLPPEKARLMEEALARLDPDQERALRAYLIGFNHREIARLHGWTDSVARHRIYRGLDTLKRTLAEDVA